MGRRRAVQPMSTKLQRVVERAKQDPHIRFTSLAHLVDVDELRLAYDRIRSQAAAGVDGLTKEQYGQQLERRLQDLHERLKRGKYRHQPIRRVHIPKDDGRGGTRPLGISCIEDKIVQAAVSRVLQAVYEPVFHDCSYGFRPGRSGHDALRAVNHMAMFEGIGWVVEADIQGFFDSVDRRKLMEMLRERVTDRSMLRLVGKCLHVGVLEGEEFPKPDEGKGTAQGSIISPLLGNIYLHHVLDDWFEREVRLQLRGHAKLVRYADDFVMGFASKDDAERVLERLRSRMAEFGLQLHPEKTRLIPFRRPRGPSKPNSSAFDFLGFTVYWRRNRKGGWRLGMETRMASYRKGLRSLARWCRSHRHLSVREQHARLCRSLKGHYNYFAINGNSHRLMSFFNEVRRLWFKWLRRRSQRARRLTWDKYALYLQRHPLPAPRISVQVWTTP